MSEGFCASGTPAAVAAVPARFIPYVQLCDAPSKLPALDELVHEARSDRLYPGEGELWLDEVLDVLPPGIPISIEVPRIVHATRTVQERAQLAGGRFLCKSVAGRGTTIEACFPW